MELTPLFPFEPISTEAIPVGPQWIGQVKWDGVRILTYYDGQEVKLFNRKLNERTFHYPEVTDLRSYCHADSVILDGEIIALGPDGKPSFYEVMKRDGLRRLEKVSQIQKLVPVTYMVFDVLYWNDEWVTSYPLSERQQILAKIITPTTHVQLVENFADGDALYRVIEAQGMEGIMMKDASSSYLVNGKDQRWRKKKYYRDLIAVVGGVTLRNQIVNSLLLGLFDQQGSFWYIGHAGTGKLTQTDWRALTERIQPLVQQKMSFVNKPPRAANTLWIQPEITVKIKFAEWKEGHSLRQPSIQGFVDVPPHQCVFE
ncbi:RNA ligase family protein [Brevibacillus sp. Leaf182]|uniref:ATP-dependent DNA ligase n=1 Tax=Brevibacillus sp. Leaf182 TaxID=1736290 RepID=UPI0006F7FE56|nr:RNA ligase family protein [Brevibacillus sp. Leaf182]RAT95625.1 DNA ligase [Brevibacillus sp. Leaf182]